MLFYSILNCGSRIVTRQKFSPKNYGRIVNKYQVTNSMTSTENATVIYKSEDFNKEDFSSMKEFICGGERVPQAVRNHLTSKMPKGSCAVLYGSTEAGIFTTFLKHLNLSGVRDNIVGQVRENAQCKVVDISTRKALGHREVGEILVISEAHFNVSLKLFVKAFEALSFSSRNIADDLSKPGKHSKTAGTRPEILGTSMSKALCMFTDGRMT